MIAKAARLRDLEGSAKVTWEKPADFFAKAEAEYQDPQVWMGELYLELHRATLTTQVGTKQGNRRSENLLREAEIWAATAAVRTGHPYPYAELDRLWKEVLTHQFHDILPGSSIAWVHRETEEAHAQVAEELTGIIDTAQRALAGDPASTGTVTFNAAPHPRSGVPALAASPAAAPSGTVAVTPRPDGGFVLDNAVIRAEIDERGLLVSLYDHAAARETIAPRAAGNLLQLHQDFPNAWDAWDVDKHYRHTFTDVLGISSLTSTTSPTTAAVTITRSFSNSTVTQTITLAADDRRLDIDTEVDWHETEKFLKLAFPLDVRAERYAAETQFGHMYRPTHVNTSWEAAKFEACNHKFVHFEEPGYGIALVTESTYGHDVTRDVRSADQGTTTTVRVSLVRAPKFPDPRTDQGTHRFHHALVPGATIADAVREGYGCNQRERSVPGDAVVEPLVTVDNTAVVISALKLSDDGSGDVVVRCYEAEGGRASVLLTPGFACEGDVEICDLLERRTGIAELEGGKARLRLRPFELVTLRFRRA
jgi:alpha-mannosidase